MLYSEIIAVCSQIHSKHINTVCGQNVPRSKHTTSVIKTSQLMLCIEIFTVYHTLSLTILLFITETVCVYCPLRTAKPLY
jgi:hypothetical protein